MARPRSPIEPRLLAKRHITPDGCWEWLGQMKPDGYGKISVANRQMPVHRAAYVALVGAIPTGKMVCHHCDNRKCFNPDHLYIGDAGTNARDMIERGRNWGRRVLKDEQVREIVRLLEEGKLTQGAIGYRMGVSQITVSRIKLGQRLYLRPLLQGEH
jgi:hypothetical protein